MPNVQEDNSLDNEGAVAIVGMACRFAGATDLQAFWNLLLEQSCGVRQLSDEALLSAGVPPEVLRDPAYVKANGSLEDALCFDAGFFGYSPQEAALIDPQHRVFLEACWQARENAIGARSPEERIGVYAGVGFNTYLLTHVHAGSKSWQGPDRWRAGIANDKDTLTSRVAYKLGLTGPAVTVQTACSTSLVAVHLACQAILDGDCEMALAGGASVHFPLGHGYRYYDQGVEATDGVCRPFSPNATGTVFTDGVGVVVLRRYEEALRAGDRIYAVIRGSAINNDAADKVGFTAPGLRGQVEVIRMAHAVAGVSSDAIDYVEAHGTGTTVGDSIELQALERAFGAGKTSGSPCLLGAVKGNIGHADSAAGIAGLIKVALSLFHRQWPSTLHVPEHAERSDGSRFSVCRQLTSWQDDTRLRMAGISSFGIGGTNAHVIVQQAPEQALGGQAYSAGSPDSGWTAGYCFKRTHLEYQPSPTTSPASEPGVHLTQMQWVADFERRPVGQGALGHVLLVAAVPPPMALLSHLQAQGTFDLWLHAGCDPEQGWDCPVDRRFDFTDSAQWDQAWVTRTQVQPPSVIIYLGGLESTQVSFNSTLACALGLGRWIARTRNSDWPSMGVHWVSAGLFVADGAALLPEHVAIWGPARVLTQEVAGVYCRLYDVRAGRHQRATQVWSTLTALICAEQASPQAHEQKGGFVPYALRGQRVFVPSPISIPPVSAPPSGSSVLREGGTYLITGGAGGIGRELATWLSAHYRARVIACGRRPIEMVEGWDAFQAQYPTVLYVQADVQSDAQLTAIVQQTGIALHEIQGVFHCAGLAGEGGLGTKDIGAAWQRCVAKVAGAQTLGRVFADVPLDFMVFFSSINGWVGGPGQAEYCSANAYLDALAQSGDTPWRTLSIAWDTWLNTGMARRSAVPSGRLPAQGQPSWALTLPAHCWLLHEHRVDEVALLPATAHVAFLLQASQGGELVDLKLLNPALVREGAPMHLAVSGQAGSGVPLQVADSSGLVLSTARTGEWHSGSKNADSALSVPPFSMTAAQHCEIHLPARLQVGERWHCVEGVSRCASVYRVELSTESLMQDFDEWPWHPAVMDVALLPIQMEAGSFSVPVAFERVQATESLATARFSYVSLRESSSVQQVADICITDAGNAVLMSMSGVTFVALEARVLREKTVTDEAFSRGLTVPTALEQLQHLLDHCALDTIMLTAASVPELQRLSEERASRYRRITVQSADMTEPVVQQILFRERLLCQLVASSLGHDAVTPEDNFFTLGGDSLSGLLLIENARKEGFQFSLNALYEAKTLADLARKGNWGRQLNDTVSRVEPFSLLHDDDRARLEGHVVDAFPLTELQKGVAYYRARYDGPSLYRDLLWADLEGVLDETLLRQAWAHCIQRHPVLRSQVDLKEFHEPLQIVHAHSEAPLLVGDLAGRSVREWAMQTDLESICPVGPAVYVFALPDGDLLHVVLLLDDALLDGWSSTSLLSQLLIGYGRLLDGQVLSAQPALPLSFHDHVRHERDIIAAGQEREFWRGRLAGCVPSSLARSLVPEPDQTPRITVCEMPFAAARHLDALARSCATTPKVVLLASYLRALSLWCSTSEVTTGLETHTRLDTDGGGEVLGLHLNMLPFRHVFSSMPVKQYLGAVAEAEALTIVHRHLPLSEIQRDWSVALFDNCFNFTQFRKLHELAGTGSLGQNLHFKGYGGEEKTHYPFKLWVDCSRAGVYQLYIAFDRGRLTEEQAQKIASLFDQVLEAFARRPEADVMSITVETDKAGMPRSTQAIPSLGDLFQHAWQVHADRIAVREGQQVFTYRDLSMAVQCTATELRRQGCQPGMTVALAMPRTFGWVVSMLGALKAGATILLIDPYLPQARIDLMLRQGRPGLIVADPGVRQDRLANWRGPVIAPVQEAAWRLEQPIEPWTCCLDLPAYVIFTSGSMGVPKGVLGTCAGLANRIAWQLHRYPLEPGDLLLSRTPASFVDVFWENLGPLCAGATLLIANDEQSRDPACIVQLLQRWPVTHLVIVPTLLDPVLTEIAKSPPRAELDLRQVSVSGEPLKAALMARAHALLPRVRWLNLYGSSEVSADVSAFELDQWQTRSNASLNVPVGSALSNVGLHLLDDNLQPVPPGCTGALYVSGRALAHGYLHQPALTAARFIPNPWSEGEDDTRLFRTGDMGREGPDGLEIVGRSDRQVKVRGVRIDLDDLEGRLERLAPVLRAAVVDSSGRLTAYVQCQPQVDPEQLWPALREQLLPEERPAQLRLVTGMPLTGAGKIDRLALVGTGTLHSDRAQVPLQGDAEIRLAVLWRELLPHASVHADSHFDELGGHSLLVLQLAGAIERTFGLRLGIATLQATTQLRAQALLLQVRGSTPLAQERHLESDLATQLLPFAPTSLQQAYWVARHREGQDGGSSHVYQEWQIPTLDVPRLEAAWNRLIERHGMLRAHIESDGLLTVRETHTYRIEHDDLSALSPQACEAQLLRWREQHALEPLTDRDEPFQLRVFQLPGGQCVLVVKFDLLFADAWSMGIIARELWALYAAPAIELPVLKISFRDVLEHARMHDHHATREAARRYWSERMAGFSGVPHLPVRAQTPERLTVRRLDLVLESPQKQALESLAARAGLSLSSLLLAAYAAVLQRWSVKKAFALTLTLFDRPFVHPQVNHVVGDFTSVLWLAIQGERPDAFLDFARSLHGQLLEGLEHRAFNGIDLARAVQSQWREVDAMRYVFTYIAEVDGGSAVFPADCVERYRITRTAGVWIDNQVVGEAGKLRLHWDVVDERFAEGVVDDMFVAYRALVEALLAAADGASHAEGIELRLPPAQQARRQTDHQADPLWQDYLATIEAHCVETPDAIAVIAGDTRLTYAQLWAQAQHLACYLKAVAPEAESVAIHLEPGWRYVVVVLATQMAGVAYVPLSVRWPRVRVIDVMQAYGIAHVFSDEEVATWSPELSRTQVLSVSGPGNTHEVLAPLKMASDPSLLAYVIFTSGSSGEPKGVMMRRGAVANTLRDICTRLRMNRSSRVFGLSDPGFDLSVFDMLGTLMVGGALVLPEAEDRMNPQAWWSLCRRHAVTIWNTAPALFEMLADYGIGKTDRLGTLGLRWVMLSGDWIPLSLPEQLRELAPGARLLSLGGATEAGIWSVSFPVTTVQSSWISIPYGLPLRGQRCDIVDEFGESCPDGVVGELTIAGASLSDGYWQRPVLTERAFYIDERTGERRYRTGDLARYRTDGVIELLGRMDSQIKIAGHRIECMEVEHAVLTHPGVTRAIVVPIKGHGALVLHAVLEHEDGVSIESIRQHCAQRLPEPMVPRHWHRYPRIPLSDNGKVDRRALQEQVKATLQEQEKV